jgi:NitT/TauT family transport system substrate-binding protein
VDQLLADGTGHLVAAMGDATGALPFSSFMTSRATLTGDRERLVRFVRGLHRAQRWMAASGARDIAAAIAPAFADIDASIRVAAVERYLRQSTWAPDPVLTRPGFEALQSILIAGGFIKRPHRFEDLVDVEIARQAAGY